MYSTAVVSAQDNSAPGLLGHPDTVDDDVSLWMGPPAGAALLARAGDSPSKS